MPFIRFFAAAVAGIVTASGIAFADPNFPFEEFPEHLAGVDTGVLLPPDTFKGYVGSQQTAPNTTAGTGKQTYFGGARWRHGNQPQAAWNIQVFDDPPNTPINGRMTNITYFSFGGDLKFPLTESQTLSAALRVAAEAGFYRAGGPDNTAKGRQTYGFGVSLPVTWRLTERWALGADAGVTFLPDTQQGETGFGRRLTAGASVIWQPVDRLFLHAGAKGVRRELGLAAIDAPSATDPQMLWSLGGRWALTPQMALDLYATNGFGVSPITDDMLFFADKQNPSFGLVLSYVPSRRDEPIPRYAPFVEDRVAALRPEGFADGITITSPQTLAPDQLRVRASYTASGNYAVSGYFSTDPDIQYDVTLEQYAIDAATGFRSAAVEDLRYQIGGRWQAMDQRYGHPVSLGFRTLVGRDIRKPTTGVIFGEAMAAREFGDWGQLVLNPRYGATGDGGRYGIGLGASVALGDRNVVMGEYSYTGPAHGDVWAVGVRHELAGTPLSVEAFATNAAGREGIGSVLARGSTDFGVALHWERRLGWF